MASTNRTTAADLRQLWAAWERDRAPAARDALIIHYAPLVKYVAGRVGVGLPRSVEQSDLVSYGMFGLIDAIDKFEAGRGFKFETYAISRIRGAILDELRTVDWVPRSVRSKIRRIEQAIATLEASGARAPTDDELAAELGWTPEQVQAALGDISHVGVVALDEILVASAVRGEALTLGEILADGTAHGPAGAFAMAEIRRDLGQAIRALPEREKVVLALYYFENLTLREIGRVLGVTESRVSQIHTQAVLRLRTRLRAAERHPAG
jgi:RNA polymerase sigma factor for flagellar operon FliA